MYTISLKLNCPFKYGCQYYDFSEGSLIFAAPEQVVKIDAKDYELKQEGWMLCFHPDLIRNSEMGRKIDEFTFFSYDVNEALHLSEKEKVIITNIVNTIENEFSQNIDEYSQEAEILEDRMSQAWINFAKTGKPSADNLPEWKVYNREDGATMILDNKVKLVHNHDKELMKLLAPDYK